MASVTWRAQFPQVMPSTAISVIASGGSAENRPVGGAGFAGVMLIPFTGWNVMVMWLRVHSEESSIEER
jgi:hypothetical protein